MGPALVGRLAGTCPGDGVRLLGSVEFGRRDTRRACVNVPRAPRYRISLCAIRRTAAVGAGAAGWHLYQRVPLGRPPREPQGVHRPENGTFKTSSGTSSLATGLERFYQTHYGLGFVATIR